MAKRDHAKGSISFPFVALPREVIQSLEWQALPHSSKALAVDLMAQYTGKNNGRLCAAYTAMQKCGWKSPHTLIAAKRALLECRFVVLTRKGHPPRTAEWIAFTWWRLDYEKTMDIDPSKFPYLNFVTDKIAQQINTKTNCDKPTGKLIPVVQFLHRCTPKKAPGTAETAPMEVVS